MDNALHRAFTMASLATEFVGRAIGFDDGENLLISAEDQELISFAAVETKTAIKRARDLFDKLEEDGR